MKQVIHKYKYKRSPHTSHMCGSGDKIKHSKFYWESVTCGACLELKPKEAQVQKNANI